MGIFTVEL